MANVSYVDATCLYPGNPAPAVDGLSLDIEDGMDGRLQQCDTPRNLYDRPVNAFVGGFIGSPAMNLRQVDLVPGGAQLGNVVPPLGSAVLDAAPGSAEGRSQ
jgi:ABC-type sugar transport system ATPase subunit